MLLRVLHEISTKWRPSSRCVVDERLALRGRRPFHEALSLLVKSDREHTSLGICVRCDFAHPIVEAVIRLDVRAPRYVWDRKPLLPGQLAGLIQATQLRLSNVVIEFVPKNS